jgi:hypothetical protein
METLLENIDLKIEEAYSDLIRLISSLDGEQINAVPFEGSWTAGQLAQHVIKFSSGSLKLLNGPAEEMKRNPGELIERIRMDFLNFKTKFASPDFVVPENKNYVREDLVISLKKINEQIMEAVLKLDLTKGYPAFEFPVYGNLSGLEVIHFLLYHTQRHIHQLKNIIKSLNQEIGT